MADKLTQEQIDECKLLIKRYLKLDNEKSDIRNKIDNILGNYKDTLVEYQQEKIIEAMEVSDDFITGIYDDEFPSFLKGHFDELEEDDSNE